MYKQQAGLRCLQLAGPAWEWHQAGCEASAMRMHRYICMMMSSICFALDSPAVQ